MFVNVRDNIEKRHVFVVCAYKESPYLESCVRSLKKQSVKTDIIMCTSTPCEFISNVSKKYNVPLYIRNGKSDIRDDWNFGYNIADGKYVTIAHQDDVYHRDYTKVMLKTIMSSSEKDELIFFSDYRPIKNGHTTIDINCILRGILRIPALVPFMRNKKIIKQAMLAFGNSICCPAVTYNKERLGENVFTSDMKFNIDWDTFLKLSNIKGSFMYAAKPLVYYRIHNGATSKEFIDNSGRIKEDTQMFRKFWPGFMVKLIMRFYIKAYETYEKRGV